MGGGPARDGPQGRRPPAGPGLPDAGGRDGRRRGAARAGRRAGRARARGGHPGQRARRRAGGDRVARATPRVEERARAASEVVGVLVGQGFIHATEAATRSARWPPRACSRARWSRPRSPRRRTPSATTAGLDAQRGVRLVDHAERLELGDEDDVARRDRQVVLALGLARAVDPADVGVDQRDEVGVVGVEEVRGPRAVALVGELQRAFDDVALGLDPDALAAELHRAVSAIGTALIGCAVFDADAILRPVVRPPVEDLSGVALFDAHTHVGQNDPDGFKQTPEELLEALERASTPRRSCSRCTSPTATRRPTTS